MIKKNNLLFIAAIVWMIAGFNILRIGFIAYESYINLINIILSGAVFLVFWIKIFSKLVNKHTERITAYEEEFQKFYKFFDRPSFIIMAVMMTMGISLRAFSLVPDRFIAVFYTGLGTALFLAGLLFLYNFYLNACPRAKKEV